MSLGAVSSLGDEADFAVRDPSAGVCGAVVLHQVAHVSRLARFLLGEAVDVVCVCTRFTDLHRQCGDVIRVNRHIGDDPSYPFGLLLTLEPRNDHLQKARHGQH